MKAWWYRLSEREQRLMLITGGLLLIAVFWWGVWQPLQQELSQAETAAARQQSTYQWMQEQAQLALELQASQPVTSSAKFTGSLSQLASSTSKRYGLRISRLQPGTDGQLQVFVDDSEFNQLLAWLGYLRGRGITIDSIDMAATDKLGYVKLRRLVLRSDA